MTTVDLNRSNRTTFYMERSKLSAGFCREALYDGARWRGECHCDGCVTLAGPAVSAGPGSAPGAPSVSYHCNYCDLSAGRNTVGIGTPSCLCQWWQRLCQVILEVRAGLWP